MFKQFWNHEVSSILIQMPPYFFFVAGKIYIFYSLFLNNSLR
jgi:hypothetical protein